MVHRLEFSNTCNDPIEVEEIGNPSESSEQKATLEEEDSSENAFRKIGSLGDSKDVKTYKWFRA